MKNIVEVDIDTSRTNTVMIGKANGLTGNETKDELAEIIVLDMATLCEGICTLIHVADQQGLKPSADSLRDCIKHLQDGFSDANYIGKFSNDVKKSNTPSIPLPNDNEIENQFGSWLGKQEFNFGGEINEKVETLLNIAFVVGAKYTRQEIENQLLKNNIESHL